MKWRFISLMLMLTLTTGRNVRGANISVGWTRSLSPDIYVYRVYYSTDPNHLTNYTQVPGFSSQAILSGLSSNVTYFIAATSVDARGNESSLSEPIQWLINAQSELKAVDLSFSGLEDSPSPLDLNLPGVNGPVTYSIQSPPANGVLIGIAPSLVYWPRTNFFGTDQFIYTISDGINAASATVTIDVAPANDPPTLDPLNVLVVSQNCGTQAVTLTGITSGTGDSPQTLSISAVSTNPRIIPNPTISYTNPDNSGTLYFSPATNAIGWSTIRVTVRDDGPTNNEITRNFSVLINNPPTLDPIADILIPQDAGLQLIALSGITSGASNEVQPLTISVFSSNPALILPPTLSYLSPETNGKIEFTPVSGRFGTAKITVIVRDGQYSNNSITRTFAVRVVPPVDLPTLNGIRSVTVDSRAGPQTIALSAISAGVANDPNLLKITARSSNPTLVPDPVISFSPRNSTGSLTFLPALNRAGSATITVTVDNGQPANNIITRSFLITVTTPPKISTLASTENAREIHLSWITDQNASCVVEFGRNEAYDEGTATSFGTNHLVTLTNLEPQSAYYIRIHALTPLGTATILSSVLTDAPHTILSEAELGLGNNQAQKFLSDKSSNGAYLSAASTNDFTVDYTFYLERGLNYRLWARAQVPASGFALSVDGGPPTNVSLQNNGDGGQWAWGTLVGLGTATPAEYPLNEGWHKFKIFANPSVKIDEVAIVNDPLWVPVLPTTRPQLAAIRDETGLTTLTWDDPSQNAIEVAIEMSSDGVAFLPWVVIDSDQTSADVGVVNGSISFRIRSFNEVDSTDYSNVVGPFDPPPVAGILLPKKPKSDQVPEPISPHAGQFDLQDQ